MVDVLLSLYHTDSSMTDNQNNFFYALSSFYTFFYIYHALSILIMVLKGTLGLRCIHILWRGTVSA